MTQIVGIHGINIPRNTHNGLNAMFWFQSLESHMSDPFELAIHALEIVLHWNNDTHARYYVY